MDENRQHEHVSETEAGRIAWELLGEEEENEERGGRAEYRAALDMENARDTAYYDIYAAVRHAFRMGLKKRDVDMAVREACSFKNSHDRKQTALSHRRENRGTGSNS